MNRLQPGESPSSTAFKCRLVAEHILKQYVAHISSQISGPLMVMMQAPIGSGVESVITALQEMLSRPPNALNVAVLSMNDLYMRNKDFNQQKAIHRTNELLSTKGLPGTYDLSLAKTVFDSIINSPDTYSSIPFPKYDSSLCEGEGDRSEDDIQTQTPIDIFILQGWTLGFDPLPTNRLEKIYTSAQVSNEKPYFVKFPLDSLSTVNHMLAGIDSTIYGYFNVFVRFDPHDLDCVRGWLDGVKIGEATAVDEGKVSEQVDSITRRYLAAYELWSGRATEGMSAGGWKGRTLCMEIGGGTEVMSVEFS